MKRKSLEWFQMMTSNGSLTVNLSTKLHFYLGGFHDIIHLVMQWTGQDFEDGGRFVFDITSMVKTDFPKLPTSFTHSVT